MFKKVYIHFNTDYPLSWEVTYYEENGVREITEIDDGTIDGYHVEGYSEKEINDLFEEALEKENSK